ncbi:MAG: SAM-dependent methyltransferase [Bacteroidota bacterium]
MEYTFVSESPIWQIQKKFYLDTGIEVWNNRVPFYATSNTFIADSYVNVVITYARECIELKKVPADTSFYIIEFGAGTGKFTFLFLKRLIELQVALGCTQIRFKYLATDISEENLQFIKQHPALEEYVANGYLELALFDLQENNDLSLLNTGKSMKISADFVKTNPCILIANYVFDSLPYDAFRISEGVLAAAKLRFDNMLHTLPNNQSIPLSTIGDIQYEFAEPGYDKDPVAHSVINEYVKTGFEGFFTVPVSVLRFLQKFLKFNDVPHLLLSTDKSVHSELGSYSLSEPEITYHNGCFSSMVDFTTIGMAFELSGGYCFRQTMPSDILTSAFFSGVTENEMPQTNVALMNHLDTNGPGALLNMYKLLVEQGNKMTLAQLFSILELLHWDCVALDGSAQALYEKLENASVDMLGCLAKSLPKAYHQFYYTPGSIDTIFTIAWLLQRTKQYEAAMIYYDLSISFFGPTEHTLFCKAICYMETQNINEAKNCFRQVLGINPAHVKSKNWMERLEKEKL